MAKKKVNKSRPKKQFHLWEKFRVLHWIPKLLVLSATIILSFFAFKFCVNTYNIRLLNKAEAKMRALNLPKADYTTYQRSCSFRSVKFGGAGSPNCDVTRRDVFYDKDAEDARSIGETYQAEIFRHYPLATSRFENGSELVERLKKNDGHADIEGIPLQDSLKCYISFTLMDGAGISIILTTKLAPEKSSNLVVSTACYKRFMFQTYPEL